MNYLLIGQSEKTCPNCGAPLRESKVDGKAVKVCDSENIVFYVHSKVINRNAPLTKLNINGTERRNMWYGIWFIVFAVIAFLFVWSFTQTVLTLWMLIPAILLIVGVILIYRDYRKYKT